MKKSNTPPVEEIQRLLSVPSRQGFTTLLLLCAKNCHKLCGLLNESLVKSEQKCEINTEDIYVSMTLTDDEARKRWL